MKKQNIFERIDAHFEGKKQSEVVMFGFLVGIIIAFLIYMYLFPIAQSYFDDGVSRNQDITTKLLNEKEYLRQVKEGNVVANLKTDISNTKLRLEKVRETNAYVDKRLRELSYLLFNDKNWAKFLDSISEIAQKNKVKILRLQSNINEPSVNKIEQILNVTVDVKGKYHGIMKFINSLEESMLIVDINKIELLGKKLINGQINIAVWGMKY